MLEGIENTVKKQEGQVDVIRKLWAEPVIVFIGIDGVGVKSFMNWSILP